MQEHDVVSIERALESWAEGWRTKDARLAAKARRALGEVPGRAPHRELTPYGEAAELVADLDTPTSGQVFIGDVDLTMLSEKALTLLRRRKVGFVFQAYNLVPTLTAAENITLPLDIAGEEPEKAWFDRVVDTVGIRDRLSHRPAELSGGQQQRVAIARSLVNEPAILLADEPTGNLDSRTSEEVMAIFQALNDEGKTVILITHEPDIAEYAKRVVHFRDGLVERVEAGHRSGAPVHS